MTRLSTTARLVIAASLLATHAYAESQAEIAARENEEGKQLMFENKYSEASAKFMSAHSRVPEPKYFFNHCTSLFWEGKFGEALTACNAADKNADDKLKPKIATFEDKIRAEAQKQNVPLEPVGGGGGPGDTPPNTTGQQVGQTGPNGQPTGPVGPSGQPTGPMPPQQQQPYAVGRPPSMGLFSQGRPENTYSWSLGIDFYGGGGRVGQPGFYGHAAGGFRVKGDYMLNPAQRIGAQGYFQLTNYSAGNDMTMTGASTLSIFDLGIAGYKHLCGATSRICLTPLIGAQLALLSPSNQTDSTGNTVFNYASLGARAEMSLQFMLGSRYQHVLQGMFGLNAYTGAFSEPSDCTPGVDCKEALGLDKGGASFYIGAGYTYRFNTPFGSAPFVTLE